MAEMDACVEAERVGLYRDAGVDCGGSQPRGQIAPDGGDFRRAFAAGVEIARRGANAAPAHAGDVPHRTIDVEAGRRGLDELGQRVARAAQALAQRQAHRRTRASRRRAQRALSAANAAAPAGPKG